MHLSLLNYDLLRTVLAMGQASTSVTFFAKPNLRCGIFAVTTPVWGSWPCAWAACMHLIVFSILGCGATHATPVVADTHGAIFVPFA